MAKHPLSVLLGLLLVLAGLGGALCLGVSGAERCAEEDVTEADEPDPVPRARSQRSGELRRLIRRRPEAINYGDNTSTEQAQVELRAHQAAIRARAWELGAEQTARRLADAEREHWRRERSGAAGDLDLDRLAQTIAAAADADERHGLIRSFQHGAAALESPEREHRLAQLDALIARR